MKKIIIVLVLLLMAFSLCSAEDLDEFAFWAKEIPTMYEAIEDYAVSTWEGLPDLVIKEINHQSYYMYMSAYVVDIYSILYPEVKEYMSNVIDGIVNNGWLMDWKLVYEDLRAILRGE